jgi:GntR family phosphonate transport system transcriptional regulator
MPKLTLWTAIRDAIVEDIAQSAYMSGEKLPREADLAQRFGVNRHTVRRALHDLVANGTLTSRRGAGFYVAVKPTRYEIGQAPQFTRNVQQSGRFAEKNSDRIEVRQATKLESSFLHGAQNVVVFEGTGLIDSVPVSWFSSKFDADRHPELADLFRKKPSVSRAWHELDLTVHRSRTDISACNADSLMAQRLAIPTGHPLLKTISVDADQDGRPVEYGESWFVGDRLTLSLLG